VARARAELEHDVAVLARYLLEEGRRDQDAVREPEQLAPEAAEVVAPRVLGSGELQRHGSIGD
jgi:hypothetical protein